MVFVVAASSDLECGVLISANTLGSASVRDSPATLTNGSALGVGAGSKTTCRSGSSAPLFCQGKSTPESLKP